MDKIAGIISNTLRTDDLFGGLMGQDFYVTIFRAHQDLATVIFKWIDGCNRLVSAHFHFVERNAYGSELRISEHDADEKTVTDLVGGLAHRLSRGESIPHHRVIIDFVSSGNGSLA